jgi:glutaredoxin
MALKVELGQVVPLVEAAPDVPRELAGLVHRAMAPRPELRFATATEMRLALASVMHGKRVATMPMAPPPRVRTVKMLPEPAQAALAEPAIPSMYPVPARRLRSPLVWLGLTVLALVLAAGVGVGLTVSDGGVTDTRASSSSWPTAECARRSEATPSIPQHEPRIPDRSRSEATTAAPVVPSSGAAVTVYTARWCPACRSLEASLRQRSIPFDKVDVDKDRAAYVAAANAAGKHRGVPLTRVQRGAVVTWVEGADTGGVERAYRGNREEPRGERRASHRRGPGASPPLLKFAATS